MSRAPLRPARPPPRATSSMGPRGRTAQPPAPLAWLPRRRRAGSARAPDRAGQWRAGGAGHRASLPATAGRSPRGRNPPRPGHRPTTGSSPYSSSPSPGRTDSGVPAGPVSRGDSPCGSPARRPASWRACRRDAPTPGPPARSPGSAPTSPLVRAAARPGRGSRPGRIPRGSAHARPPSPGSTPESRHVRSRGRGNRRYAAGRPRRPVAPGRRAASPRAETANPRRRVAGDAPAWSSSRRGAARRSAGAAWCA
jgi:hypothetical protein